MLLTFRAAVPLPGQTASGHLPRHLNQVHSLYRQVIDPVTIVKLHHRRQKMAYVYGAAAAGPGLPLAHAYHPVRVSGQHRLVPPGLPRLIVEKFQHIPPQLPDIPAKGLILLKEIFVKCHSVYHVLRHKIAMALLPGQLHRPLHNLLHISAKFHHSSPCCSLRTAYGLHLQGIPL